jgi:hypothetical protein
VAGSEIFGVVEDFGLEVEGELGEGSDELG